MECDLFEVSGQMALPPPPPQLLARLSRTSRRRPLTRRLLMVPHDLLWITNAARLWSADEPGWLTGRNQPPAHGSATRAEGEKPDDRSLEAVAILLGLFFLVAVGGVIAMAWTLVPRSASGVIEASASRGRGWAVRRRRDLLQASPPVRKQERGYPRGACQFLPRLVQGRPIGAPGCP